MRTNRQAALCGPLPRFSPPDGAALRTALDTVQALGRAEGAVLFIPDEEGLTAVVSTADSYRLGHATAIGRTVLESGRVISGAMGSGTPAVPRGAFRAVPLLLEGRLMGVLYLEGLTCPSAHVEALIGRCAQVIARMLERPAWLAELAAWRHEAAMRVAPAPESR